MRWPDTLRRYVCTAAANPAPGVYTRSFVYVALDTAAYCPRCGGALDDFRHEYSGAGNVSIEDNEAS